MTKEKKERKRDEIKRNEYVKKEKKDQKKEGKKERRFDWKQSKERFVQNNGCLLVFTQKVNRMCHMITGVQRFVYSCVWMR